MAVDIPITDPVDWAINENWLHIMRWAAKRACRDSVNGVTRDELDEAKAIWRRTLERGGDMPPPLDAPSP